MWLLQKELDKVSSIWNNHRMRAVKNSECPAGRSVVSYSASKLLAGCELGSRVTINDLILAETFCLKLSSFGCSTNFVHVASFIMHKNSCCARYQLID